MPTIRNWASLPAEDPGTKAGDAHDESASSKSRKGWMHTVATLAACASWVIASTSAIVANRVILVEKDFPYPMAVASMGMAVSGIAGIIACDVLKLAPPVTDLSPKYYFTRILPVGVAQGIAGWLSNTLYLYLTVSFIEMARASLPLFTLLALHFSKLETPAIAGVKAVCLAAMGCCIVASVEVHLTVVGIIFLLSSLLLLLVGSDYHPLQGLKLISPGAVVCLLVMSAVSELPSMIVSGAGSVVLANFPLFCTAASLGLIVNMLSMVIIKLVVIIKLLSATTVQVLASVRGPLVVVLGALVFKETVTGLEVVGYAIALTGFIWYQHGKLQQTLTVRKGSDITTTC
eukprot:gene19399-26052_t